MQINKQAFEQAISKIEDGDIFESFGKEFLAAALGYDFIPVGGTKDKGIDAFQHVSFRKGNDKIIYQMSTEKSYEEKIKNTILTLKENGINFSKLVYVTNRKVNNAEAIVDDVFDKDSINLTIYDIRWLTENSNNSPKTIRAYQIFVDTYLHEYSKPGKYTTVADLNDDSRLYVFLGQQFENYRTDLRLDNLLADTLIIYSLEETDPDLQIFKTRSQIKEHIKKYLKFDPQLIDYKIDVRLEALISKPRKINYHPKVKGYCLPYETRVEIEERNLADEMLYTQFHEQTKVTVQKYFKEISVNVKDVESLITKVFNKIFKKQGLEFSNFVLHGDSQSVIEQKLNDVISQAVDDSSVVMTNKEKVKIAMHLSIRDIIYNGTSEQRKFLKSLSNTYLMMFLLQWEPKLSTYFETVASQLKVFVDNSIIIPAMSEYFLPEGNRRHWNLLKGARKAGISMFINETLLDELVSHFHMIKNKYYSFFDKTEDLYLTEEYELLFIDEIIIRAYFYAKKKGQVPNFDSFLNNFVGPDLRTVKDDLIMYLKEMFSITYISNKAWDIKIDINEKDKLTEKLTIRKTNESKAETDAEMILAIYYLRSKNNEESSNGIFGYKTWWLSKDTSTYKAVKEAFGKKYPVSCYIRPDFVYNYIALMPSTHEVDEAYNEIFPTMLGVNLSYHMPKEVAQTVQQKIQDFHDKPKVRVKQILKTLSDRLKTDPNYRNRQTVELFLDGELAKINEGNMF